MVKDNHRFHLFLNTAFHCKEEQSNNTMQPKRSLCKGSHLRLATQTQKKKTELKSQALIKVVFLITQSTFIFPIKKGGKTICKEVHFTPVKEENKLS